MWELDYKESWYNIVKLKKKIKKRNKQKKKTGGKKSNTVKKKKESWAPKNWCLWTVVLEKTLESPLGCKEFQPVHPKGDQYWVFIGRTDVEAETPIFWPPDAKSWLIWKDPDAGKDWGKEEKGTTEDEMVGWHHRLDGHEFEWTPGVGDGQGGLVCYDSWDCKELDTTERLNWTELLTTTRSLSTATKTQRSQINKYIKLKNNNRVQMTHLAPSYRFKCLEFRSMYSYFQKTLQVVVIAYWQSR